MNRSSIIKTGIAVIAVLVLFSFIPGTANAQGLVPCGGPGQPPCEICHVFQLFGNIVNTIVWRLVPAIATIMIIVTGIRFFTAMGKPSELEKIKAMFRGIAFGFLIVVLAWSITVALYSVMGAGTPVGWWNIPGCP